MSEDELLALLERSRARLPTEKERRNSENWVQKYFRTHIPIVIFVPHLSLFLMPKNFSREIEFFILSARESSRRTHRSFVNVNLDKDLIIKA